jgi:uncharacterized protein (DUF2384 family)
MAEPEHRAKEQIVRHAEKTFGAEKAQLWLDRKTPALGGEAPRALLRTEEGRFAVEQLLARVDHGLAS